MYKFNYKNYITTLILIFVICINLIDIKLSNSANTISILSDIILSIFLFSVYISYTYSKEKFRLIGFISIAYICIVIFFNRRFSFPTTLDIILVLPFLISILYFLKLLFSKFS